MTVTEPNILKTLRSDTLYKVNQGKKRTYAFNVDFSDIDPEFVGKFIVHYPSQIERLQIGVTKSALLGGNSNVDVITDNIAHITATLDTVLDFKPEWFDIDNPFLEYEMLEAVYMEYNQWVNTFRKSAKPSQPTGDSPVAGSEVPMVDTKDIPSTSDRL